MAVNLGGVPASVYPVLTGQRGPADLQEQLWLQWYQGQVAAENAALQQAETERQRLASVDAANQAAIAQSSSTNVMPTSAPATTPAGPTASELVAGAFPSGFESSYIGAGLTDPFEQQALTSGRTKAEDFISNLLKRGSITETGRTSAMNALAQQDPAVRARLNDIGNVLLEGEKAKLRGIASEASGAAQGLPGEGFDVAPYAGRVASETAAFQAGLPGAYSAAIPAGDLFSVAGLPGAAGAVSGPQVAGQYDPYAVAGGQLKTGLEEEAPPAEDKKRTTAVF